MNCADVQELLSAYYDGELGREPATQVREHLGRCSQCAAQLADFTRLSTLAAGLPTPQTPGAIWDRLESELDADVASPPSASHIQEPRPTSRPCHTPSASRITTNALALAATLLVAVGLGWFTYGTWFMHGARHDGFVTEFGHYLQAFQQNPDEAQQMLLAKYDGVPVDPAQATKLVGYRPMMPEAAHDQYQVKSMHVLRMPCCTCVQTVCERRDGSTVTIFEHTDKNPPWFGDRSGTMADCSGQRCRLFDLQSSIAVHWQSGNRYITAIGVRDKHEADDLVKWLQPDAQNGSS
jgi:hypothetical protein